LGRRAMVIRQGDVFWLHFQGTGSKPDGRRPAVVVQHDRFNRSAISTSVVAAITSNVRLAAMPGNVRLRKGEANLARPCVVNVSPLGTVDRGAADGTCGHPRACAFTRSTVRSRACPRPRFRGTRLGAQSLAVADPSARRPSPKAPSATKATPGGRALARTGRCLTVG
jgi:mRNA interferase MazF